MVPHVAKHEQIQKNSVHAKTNSSLVHSLI
jgi:hypothetical protein